MKKLDIGATLSRVFDLYGKQAGVLLPAAFIVFLPVMVITAILSSILFSALTQTTVTTVGGYTEVDAGALAAHAGSLAALTLVSVLLSVIGTYWYQGVVVKVVEDMEDGRQDLSVGQVFSTSAPFLMRLIGAGILLGLIFVAIGIVVALISMVIPFLGIIVAIAAFFVAIWLVVRFALLSPAIVAENVGATASFGRSKALVEGNWWQVFGVLIVLLIITAVAQAIIGAILGGIGGPAIGSALAGLVSYTLTAPLLGLAAAIIFFELRSAKEGAPAVADVAPPAPPAPPAAPAV